MICGTRSAVALFQEDIDRCRGLLKEMSKSAAEPEGFDEFAKYYKWRTDKIIQHFKDKITT